MVSDELGPVGGEGGGDDAVHVRSFVFDSVSFDRPRRAVLPLLDHLPCQRDEFTEKRRNMSDFAESPFNESLRDIVFYELSLLLKARLRSLRP